MDKKLPCYFPFGSRYIEICYLDVRHSNFDYRTSAYFVGLLCNFTIPRYRGKEKQMRAPESGFGACAAEGVEASTQMRPPCASIMARARYNPKPCAFGLLDGIGGTIEAVEDMRQVLRVDAGAFVADANHHLLGPHRTADLDLAFRCVFQGIGNKVGDHLLDPGFVGQDDGKFIREVGGDACASWIGLQTVRPRGRLRRGAKRPPG